MSEATVTPITMTLGYFNPHDYPVKVELSSHGFQLALMKKGQYIEINGVKVNDPILDRCLGSHGLARAQSTGEPVPIVFLPVAGEHKPSSPTGFVGVPGPNTAETLPAALIAQAEQAKKLNVPVNPPGITTSVTGLTYKEAVRLGYIKPTRQVNEGVDATTDVPAHQIPDLQVAVDAPPRLSAPAIQPPRIAPPAALRPPVAQPSRQLPPPVIGDEEYADESIPVAIDDPADKALLEKFGLKGTTTPTVIEAKPEPMPNPPTARVIAYKTPVLPVPNLANEPDASSVPTPLPVTTTESQSTSAAAFICEKDGKTFQHRSSLERYALKKYPEAAEAIMAHYPKK